MFTVEHKKYNNLNMRPIVPVVCEVLNCWSSPFCFVSKMFCYPLIFVGTQGTHVT